MSHLVHLFVCVLTMFVVVVLRVGHPRPRLFGGTKIEKVSEIVLTPAPVVGLRNGHPNLLNQTLTPVSTSSSPHAVASSYSCMPATVAAMPHMHF